MRKIGRVLHIASSGKAVVKAERVPKVGEVVFDEKQRQMGKVFDVFGPTGAPYVAVDVRVKDPKRVVDRDLYVSVPSKHWTKVGRQ